MSDAAAPLTIRVARTVKAGREEAFEVLLREFVPESLTFPGHLGVHVIKPAPGEGREYVVVLNFASRERWQAFQKAACYVRFRERIEPLLEAQPRVEEMTGLESWFILPSARALRPVPRWKMALLTFLGVYPTSLLLGATLGRAGAEWPHWARSMAIAAAMVTALTWLVMPTITRVLHRWIHPEDGSAARRTA